MRTPSTLILVLVTLSAASAAAQPMPSQQLDGVLAQTAETGPTGGFLNQHPLGLQAGTQVTITLTSSAFDTYLIVRPPSGAPIVNDDIAPDQLDSRVTFTVPTTGTYVVAASSYQAGATGAYHLRADFGQQGTPPSTPPTTPPSTGPSQQIDGNLASSVETGPTGGFVSQHQVQLQAGTQVTFDLTSAAFDTYLIVRPPGGAAPIVNDDIAPDQLDSRVTFTVPTTGSYVVAVSSYQPGATGAYRLVTSLGQGQGTPPATPPTAPPTTGPSQQIDGVLAQTAETGPTGGFVSQHQVQLQAGAQVTIDLTSAAFDTYLIVRPPGGAAPIVNDDIAPDQLDSRVSFTVPSTGTYVLAVSSYQPGATGAYHLAVR